MGKSLSLSLRKSSKNMNCRHHYCLLLLGSTPDPLQEVLSKDAHLSRGQGGRAHPGYSSSVFSQMQLSTRSKMRPAGRARTGQDHPSGCGRCWQDSLSCSCWAAIQSDRQNAVCKGVETHSRWQPGNRGQLGRGVADLPAFGNRVSRPADGPQQWAIPEEYSEI